MRRDDMVQLAIYLIFSVGGMALFKLGSGQMMVHATKQGVGLQFGYLSLIGILCYGCSFLLWLWIMKKYELSVIYPVMNALVIVLTAVFGMLVLGERVSLLKLVGIGLILGGVLCVGFGK
jgi:small multidrug resistance pump